MSPLQLPLDLPFNPARARDDLIVTPSNARAVDMIDAWPNWPGNTVLMVGPIGAGKTHMAEVWAAIAGATMLYPADLETIIPEPGASYVIEDVRPGEAPQTALFHFLNHLSQHGGYCVITSRELPADWGLTLPDLASRIRAAHLVELEAPDDDLLRQVIFKLFADRQMPVEPQLVDYLVARMERSLGMAGELVSEMDREALARRSPVSRSIAALALKKLGLV
ncbi:MAG: hypothetical protein WBO55_08625 [Rhizobiaceae bacterium]